MRKKARTGAAFLSAVLVISVTARVAAADVDVAVLGTASQSSTAFLGDAARAIDGNTDGNYGDGSVTHTDTTPVDLAPSWQVDLGTNRLINRVVLWGRTDCCMWRLSNFRISVLDDTATEVEGDDFFTDVSIPELSFPDTTVNGFEWVLPAPTNGRTVVVSSLGPDSQGTQFISLAEVQVFSDIAPIITKKPRGGEAYIDGKFTFTVEALGSSPLTYKWQKDNVDVVPSATSSTLTLSPVKSTHAGAYTVLLHNGSGDAASDPVNLNVFAGRDLARDGEASQSSTAFGGDVKLAIDGNTDGLYFDGSVSHTSLTDLTPSWEVFLYGPSTIETVFIWGRTDCCMERLQNFKVLVLNADRTEVWSDVFFADGTFPDTTTDGFELPTFPAGTVGQIVRIERLDSMNGSAVVLSLAEVEVIGDGPSPPLDPNLCRREGVTATQSSEYGGGLFPASNAIDGALDNFSHTNVGDTAATWEVNLGAENDIEEIVLWNRRGCCPSRLRDITVSILNLAGDATLFTSELLNPENEIGGSTADMGPDRLALNLFDLTGGFVKGGRVRIARTPDDDLSGSGGQGVPGEGEILALGEVQVFTPIECPPAGDTHCLPFFFKVTGPDAGGTGDYVVKALGKDDSGDPVKYTFSADNGMGVVRSAGPQANTQATLRLGVGNWTVSATVDDSLRCDDQAADATCSKQVAVEGKPNNKAPFGVATQSSIGFDGDPSRAIDGITDGNYGDGSMSHTATDDPAPSWEVKLAQDYFLEKIVLWNRTDCCPNRLTNFQVEVLKEDRKPVYGEEFFTDGVSFPDTTLDGFEIHLPQPTQGRIVRIGLIPGGSAYLSLAEVEVFCTTGPPPGKTFHRGDADDNGKLELTDAVRILGFLYLGKPTPTCLDAADADDNGKLELTDAVRILGFLYLGKAAPENPGPPPAACGVDPTPSDGGTDLGCIDYTNC